jgi:integrase
MLRMVPLPRKSGEEFLAGVAAALVGEEGKMSGKKHGLRGARGRFVAAAGEASGAGLELKRGRGDGIGGRPQIRAKHKRALTRAEIAAFLSSLAETCNVSHSAREAGRKARAYYDLRRRDADFRAAWMEALREGYELLEMEMVHRARFGTPRDVFYQGRKTATTRVFDDGTSLRLLHLHRKSVEQMRAADQGPKRDAKALFDELAARVAEMEAEEEAEAGEAESGAA